MSAAEKLDTEVARLVDRMSSIDPVEHPRAYDAMVHRIRELTRAANRVRRARR